MLFTAVAKNHWPPSGTPRPLCQVLPSRILQYYLLESCSTAFQNLTVLPSRISQCCLLESYCTDQSEIKYALSIRQIPLIRNTYTSPHLCLPLFQVLGFSCMAIVTGILKNGFLFKIIFIYICAQIGVCMCVYMYTQVSQALFVQRKATVLLMLIVQAIVITMIWYKDKN